jgi:hypothetical protein
VRPQAPATDREIAAYVELARRNEQGLVPYSCLLSIVEQLREQTRGLPPMVIFLDGPAENQGLFLRRSPTLLRVCVGPRGRLDALDDPADVATEDEDLYVYRLAGRPSWMHVRAGKGMGGGRWAVAFYKLLEPAPPADVVRNNDAWSVWCRTNKESLLAAWGSEVKRDYPDALAVSRRVLANLPQRVTSTKPPAKKRRGFEGPSLFG